MATFLFGILTSIVASAIIYILRFQLGFLINFIFFKLYPNISGEYNVYSFEIEKKEENLSEPVDGEGKIKDRDNKLKRLSTRASDRDLIDFLKKEKSNFYVKLKLKQFANRLTGTLYTIKKGEQKDIEKVSGVITPNRVVVLNSETILDDCHNFGTYLLTVKNDLHIIKGVRNYLCIGCGEANPNHLILEKSN